MTPDQQRRAAQLLRAMAQPLAELADLLEEDEPAERPAPAPSPRHRGPARPPPSDRPLTDIERAMAQRALDDLRRR